MVFQKSTQYTLRIFIYLAQHLDQINSVQQMHKELGIPYKYMTKLMTRISSSGLIKAIQGKRGGFQLDCNPKQLMLYKIIGINENLDLFKQCLMDQIQPCRENKVCPIHAYWHESRQKGDIFLYQTSLHDILP